MKSHQGDQLAQTLASPSLPSPGPAGAIDEVEQTSFESASSSPASGEAASGSRQSSAASPAPASSGGGVCLTDEEIQDYLEGRSAPSQQARIDEHLDDCASCRALVCVLVQEDLPAVSRARITTFSRGNMVSARYRIERFVAKSGMGEVYEAFDTLREKRVALKTVLFTSSDDPRAMRALTLEVEHALLVSHANVCRVYELGEHRNPGEDEPPVRYLTMEFVDGETLGRRLRRAPLALTEVRSIALQVLSGLSAAHAKGVLHLDFKSDNVMLRSATDTVEALIMDFGLSRTRGASSTLHPSEQELRGTPGYMAPEQLECLATSRATDVYAFGIVLFEMLVGELPFRADSLSALLLKQVRERAPAPSARRAGLSLEIDRFVAKCLECDAAQRFADAAHALSALERVTSWEATPAARRSLLRPIWGVCAALLLVLMVSGLAGWRWARARGAGSALSSTARVEQALSPAPRPAPPGRRSAAPEAPFPAPEVLSPSPAPLTPAPASSKQGLGARGVPAPPSGRKARARPEASAASSASDVTQPALAPVSSEAPRSPGEGEWRHIPRGGFWLPEDSSSRAEPPATQKVP